MSTVVQSVGYFANNTASSRSITIAATTAGSALIAFGWFSAAGTRSFSGAGGTWTQVVDHSLAPFAIWVNKSPTTGSTAITIDNGGVNCYFTAQVIEVTGLSSGGSNYSSTPVVISTPATPWATNNITAAVPTFAVVAAFQASTTGETSTLSGGFTATSGTGLSGGIVDNTTEGDGLLAAYGDQTAGTYNASGVWSTSVGGYYYLVAFERASGSGSANRIVVMM